MQKSDYLRQKKLNPSDELRDLLNILEDHQPQLKSLNQSQAINLLRMLDQVDQLFNQLQSTELSLVPEQTRFAVVQAHYKNNVAKILKALGGSAALGKHRPDPAPERARWWWYMHELVAAHQQQMVRRVLAGGVLFFAILGVLYLAFNTILAPSPEAVARLEAENNSIDAYLAGDYGQALAALEQGLAVVPNDAGLLLIRGVVYEALGDDDKSTQSFEAAKARLNDTAIYYLGRGQLYYRTNQFEKAEAEARKAIEVNENLSAGWLLLGQSLEAQGRRFESIPIYQQAGEVALSNGDNEIVVLARLALSRVGATP